MEMHSKLTYYEYKFGYVEDNWNLFFGTSSSIRQPSTSPFVFPALRLECGQSILSLDQPGYRKRDFLFYPIG